MSQSEAVMAIILMAQSAAIVGVIWRAGRRETAYRTQLRAKDEEIFRRASDTEMLRRELLGERIRLAVVHEHTRAKA
jgi:hypothetical protein